MKTETPTSELSNNAQAAIFFGTLVTLYTAPPVVKKLKRIRRNRAHAKAVAAQVN